MESGLGQVKPGQRNSARSGWGAMGRGLLPDPKPTGSEMLSG